MLCLVLGYTSRDRESIPEILYAGHDKGLALEILSAGAPGVIRTEYISHLPQAAKNRTFAVEAAAPAEAAPVLQLVETAIEEAPAEELAPETSAEESTAEVEAPWEEPDFTQPEPEPKPGKKK
jgi:hypothetical protein